MSRGIETKSGPSSSSRLTTTWPDGYSLKYCRRNVTQESTFPRPLTGPGDPELGFSFSGLKTAVARYVEKHRDADVNDVAASFQEAVADVLTAKALRACRAQDSKS